MIEPSLHAADISDRRAFLWTDATADRFLAELFVGRPGKQVLDLGCGWGSLGLALATRSRLHVHGLDLEPELLTLGKQLIRQLGFGARVRLEEGPAEEVDRWPAEADAVVCQAFLVHQPRCDELLAAVARDARPGLRFGAVEADLVEAASGLVDSVADRIEGYALTRIAVAEAVARGARERLGVDRTVGSRLAGLMRAAGYSQVTHWPLPRPRLAPPHDPAMTGWMARRLRVRIHAGADPFERSLAEAGGLPPSRFDAWVTSRQGADRARLEALERGDWLRDESAGTTVTFGTITDRG